MNVRNLADAFDNLTSQYTGPAKSITSSVSGGTNHVPYSPLLNR